MKQEPFFDSHLPAENPLPGSMMLPPETPEEEEEEAQDGIAAAPLPDEVAEEEDATDTEAETEQEEHDDAPPVRRWLGLQLKEWAIMAAVGVVFIIYYVATSSDAPKTGTGQFVQTASAPPPEASAQPAENSAPQSAISDPNELETLKNTFSHILTVQGQFSQQNREAITALSRRLDSDENRIRTLEQQVAALSAGEEALKHAAEQKPAAPAAPVAHRSSHTRRGPSIASMHINTLYPGMVWMDWNGSTWSLREGDELHGVRIEHIDVDQRQVVTSAGIVR
ncbi:hypothetical protein [Klebsiella aerogenes]|uniref:hypothetical protein n=1 Tax=Klebsiella aerogenes TaxID=548 RepID=UPI00066583B1|nr:hypothetical protein [Klebsiella aerogenes]